MNTNHYEAKITDWFDNGITGPHAVAYIDYLITHGYAKNSIRNYKISIAHFSEWADSISLQLCHIDEQQIVEFLDIHLPNCRCSRPVHSDRRNLSAALGHLLFLLRHENAIPCKQVPSDPVDIELRKYDEYMDQARGLAEGTRKMAARIVGRLLRKTYRDGPVVLATMTPGDVRQFYAEQSKFYSKPANTGSVISALRGYFRYRASLGDLTHGLAGALSYPANWQLSSLPKTLSNDEIENLVISLSHPRRSMRRNAAIVRCALDLGMRGSEIAKLSLEDINWQDGTILLRKTKGRREDVLPLPVSTGEAIAAYLTDERPKTSSRSLFVRLVAPRDRPVGPDLVRKTIRQAYAHAGLPYTRAHLLRHTMANRLLVGGSSIKEVADVLRHRSLNTAMIYAKLDCRKLLGVALPWPGSSS